MSLISYNDIKPIIDQLGKDVTVKHIDSSTVDEYGEPTITYTETTVRMLIQRYVVEDDSDRGNVKGEPEFVAYSVEEITTKDIVVLDNVNYRVIDVTKQYTDTTYVYYKAFLKRQYI